MEAQVHGGVQYARDVCKVIALSLVNVAAQRVARDGLRAFCTRNRIPLFWIGGEPPTKGADQRRTSEADPLNSELGLVDGDDPCTEIVERLTPEAIFQAARPRSKVEKCKTGAKRISKLISG